jgi:hypothetical protein
VAHQLDRERAERAEAVDVTRDRSSSVPDRLPMHHVFHHPTDVLGGLKKRNSVWVSIYFTFSLGEDEENEEDLRIIWMWRLQPSGLYFFSPFCVPFEVRTSDKDKMNQIRKKEERNGPGRICTCIYSD